MSDKFFTDEELGVTKFSKLKSDPSIIPPMVDTKTKKCPENYNQGSIKTRNKASKPWKPMGRK